jgi:RimJ/RimL family protein N-acetyltransferase
MTMHNGMTFTKGNVSIAAPNCKAVAAANCGNPWDAEWRIWREQAALQDDIYYFTIHCKDVLVGEIFLHDINLDTRESLLGYRIFSLSNRGQGVGSKALRLLQEFVANETELGRLVIITAEDNIPSRRMAEHCGFELAGSSWEDPHFVVYEWKSSLANWRSGVD